MASDAHRSAVTAEAAPAAVGPYSQAIRHGELLFCSGAVPLDPATGELDGDEPGPQTTRCLSNLAHVCEAAGTTLTAALRLTVYTTRLERFAEINEAYARAFGDEPPARATVGVEALPLGALVEIDAIVAIG